MNKIKWKLLTNMRINITNGCWEWQKGKDRDGYGQINYKQKTHRAHRVSAMIFLDFDLDSKLLVCHNCDNSSCVNFQHLFIGTHQDNMNDRNSKGRQMHGERHYMYGKKHSAETKLKISQNHADVSGAMNPAYRKPGTRLGVKLSEETKRRMSIAAVQRETRKRKTKQYTIL